MTHEECEEYLKRLIAADRRAAAWCVLQCARRVLGYVPAGEERPRLAIEAGEGWLKGEAVSVDALNEMDAAVNVVERQAQLTSVANNRYVNLAVSAAACAISSVVLIAISPDRPIGIFYACDEAVGHAIIAIHLHDGVSVEDARRELYALMQGQVWPLDAQGEERTVADLLAHSL